MITVVYDPFHDIGIPDGTAMLVAQAIVGTLPAGDKVTIGTGLVIDAIRVLVKTGEIPHDQVQFEYNGITIDIDENGHCDPWPEGFNDTMEKLLVQL